MRSILPITSILLLALATSSCASSGSYRDGVFRREGVVYQLDPPGEAWKRISLAGNDLAWSGPEGGMIAVNSECEDHGDPSLQVLTNHLLIGFEEREVLSREPFRLAGRGALRTRATAALDGVPVELELTVLKKDGCVFDLMYLAAPRLFEADLETFRRLVGSFETQGRK